MAGLFFWMPQRRATYRRQETNKDCSLQTSQRMLVMLHKGEDWPPRAQWAWIPSHDQSRLWSGRWLGRPVRWPGTARAAGSRGADKEAHHDRLKAPVLLYLWAGEDGIERGRRGTKQEGKKEKGSISNVLQHSHSVVRHSCQMMKRACLLGSV